MIVKLLTEQHLEFLSLKGGCTGLSESTLVKMPHCWKSHVTAHLCFQITECLWKSPMHIKKSSSLPCVQMNKLSPPSREFTGLDKSFERKIVNIFLPISFNICFGCFG